MDPACNSETAAEENKRRENLLLAFRSYLHFVIAAHQTTHQKGLEGLSGNGLAQFSRELAKPDDEILAWELALPAKAVAREIYDLAWPLMGELVSGRADKAGTREDYEQMLGQLDLALAWMLREIAPLARMRAKVSKSPDLLCEVMFLLGDGALAEQLVHRYAEVFPEDLRLDDDGSASPESFPEWFAWDAYLRVEALDRLADAFPEHVREAARGMHGWPMLCFRHTSNRRRFRELAKRFELAEEFPLDASERARFRPDTPMVRYLVPLVHRVHCFRWEAQDAEGEDMERELVQRFWWEWPEPVPSDELVSLLAGIRQLPELTKATVNEWAREGLVPLVMATDGLDPASCKEPALRAIWKQKGVKSRATFKSRLLTAVVSTLQGLARAA